MRTIALAVINEIADSRLYEHEASLFRSKIVEGSRISRIFERFAAEERIHLEILRGMASIDELGAFPKKPHAPPGSLRDSLRGHVDRELTSIRLCEDLIKELADPRQRLLVKGIMADEKEHLETVLKYLKHIR